MQPNDYFSDFDDLFERMTGDRAGVFGRPTRRGREADFAVDVAVDDDELVVTADVPGFESDDLDVSVDGDLLTIRADAETETSVDEDAYVRRERHHQSMRRTVRLPVEVEGNGASASYRNGVLTVSIPVDAGVDGHRIDVE